MKSISISIAVLLTSLLATAQSPEEDEIIFQSAVDWLDSKLNYTYYDPANEKWWKNTFYINEEKVVKIKHISSDILNTAHIEDKDYTIRSFRIQDIDPNSLKVTEVNETVGRIVKGKRLELRTFGFQHLINNTINNRKGSETSFLFLSFPDGDNDSLSNDIEIVKEKLKEAIIYSTHLYRKNDATDIQQVIDVLGTSFKSESNNEWKGLPIQPNVLKIETEKNEISYFGFDTNLSLFYLLKINSEKVETHYFDFIDHPLLTLQEVDGTQVIQIQSINAFRYGDVQFFRQ